MSRHLLHLLLLLSRLPRGWLSSWLLLHGSTATLLRAGHDGGVRQLTLQILLLRFVLLSIWVAAECLTDLLNIWVIGCMGGASTRLLCSSSRFTALWNHS